MRRLRNIIARMSHATHPLDSYDLHILSVLQTEGGLTNQELAARVGLSPSPCSRRVQKLEEAGVIIGQRTLLSPRHLGLSLTVMLQISMDRHTPERFQNFEEHIRDSPEVQECFLITGQEADYLLKVVVPDIDSYQEFLLNKVTRIEGVSGARSSFVMRRVIETTALPLEYVRLEQ